MNGKNNNIAEFLTDIQAVSVEQFDIISKVRELFYTHTSKPEDDIFNKHVDVYIKNAFIIANKN